MILTLGEAVGVALVVVAGILAMLLSIRKERR